MKVLEKILEFLITILSARFGRVNTLLLIHDKLFMLKLKIYFKLVGGDSSVDQKLKNFKLLVADMRYYLNFEIFSSENWIANQKNL